MDDLWGNAWSQPDERQQQEHDISLKSTTNPNKSIDTSSSWKLPTSLKNEEEADVGLPSWSTGAVNWTEPSGHAPLWGSSVGLDSPDLDGQPWGGSSVNFVPPISFDRDSNELNESQRDHDVDEVHEEQKVVVGESVESATPVRSPVLDIPDSPPASTPDEQSLATDEKTIDSQVPKTPDSPDGFGTFESGAATSRSRPVSIVEDEAWTPAKLTFDGPEEDAWATAWKSADANQPAAEAPKDEWEIAREVKLRRDRTVPPEILVSIIDRWNELAVDLWPNEAAPSPDGEQGFGNWRDGISNVDGLNALVNKVLPEMTFQPPVQFSRSHIAKSMVTSLKLSKNLPVARQSPMSHLFASKSSSAWELSVKTRVDKPVDDVPAGWRVVEPDVNEEANKPVVADKKSSGIFSFWSRRASVVPSPSPKEAQPQVLKRSSMQSAQSDRSASPAPRASLSTRPSVDVQTGIGAGAMGAVSPGAPEKSPVISLSGIPMTVPSVSESSASSQTIDASSKPSSQPSSPGPSAVSRFFNRFSRTKTESRPNTSANGSLALSSDDLDLLSDMVPSVPSHNDIDDDLVDGDQLNALASMISAPALPTKLPPPLAPPPMMKPVASGSSTALGSSSSLSLFDHPPVPPKGQAVTVNHLGVLDDLQSLVDSKHELNKPATSSVGPSSRAVSPPSLPPPLSPSSISSFSKPATPSPLSRHPSGLADVFGENQATHSRTASGSSLKFSATTPTRSTTPVTNSQFKRTTSPPPAPRPTQPSQMAVLSFGSFPVLSPPPSSRTSSPGILPPPPSSSARPLSPPVLPKPASSLSNVPTPAASSPAALKTSPLSGKNTPLPLAPISSPPSLFDDDDFSDFASPLERKTTGTTRTNGSISSTDYMFGSQSDSSIDAGDTSFDSFGEFGDFVTTTAVPTSFSTPPLPASRYDTKPVPLSPSFDLPASPPQPPQKPNPPKAGPSHIRKPSAADHQATANLVERAAAMKGRWPAPPSPLPELLPPPPGGSRSVAFGSNIIDSELPRPAMAISLKPISQINLSGKSDGLDNALLDPPTTPRPLQSQFSDPLLFDIGASQPEVKPTKPSTSSSSNSVTKGGLSAQDLSFFEGL